MYSALALWLMGGVCFGVSENVEEELFSNTPTFSSFCYCRSCLSLSFFGATEGEYSVPEIPYWLGSGRKKIVSEHEFLIERKRNNNGKDCRRLACSSCKMGGHTRYYAK